MSIELWLPLLLVIFTVIVFAIDFIKDQLRWRIHIEEIEDDEEFDWDAAERQMRKRSGLLARLTKFLVS